MNSCCISQIEDEMQRLFLSHANVFDESMQSFFIQNFIHEAECAKTFRAAMRRTSLVRRCLVAMYPSDDRSKTPTKTAKPRRWSASLASRAVTHHYKRSNSLEVCPEVVNPVVIEAVKRQLDQLASWDFDVFAVSLEHCLERASPGIGDAPLTTVRLRFVQIADAVPGQTLSIVGNALLEKFEFCSHFRSSRSRLHRFLRQCVLSSLSSSSPESCIVRLTCLHCGSRIELKYYDHPYHNGTRCSQLAAKQHTNPSVSPLLS